MTNTMTISGTDAAVHPDWLAYPIVGLAFRQAHGDPLGTLERLSALLGHVEDRCPNVDYVNLFDSHHLEGLEACQTAQQYRQLGADEDLITELFPTESVDDTTRVYLQREVAADMRAQGFKLREIADVLGYKVESSVWNLLNNKARKPKSGLTESERHVGNYRPDLTITEVARELGLNRQRVYHCRKMVKDWGDK